MLIDPRVSMRKAEIVGLLETVCQSLEPTDSQIEQAQSRYETVGTWVAEADDPELKRIKIYLQGSTAIGTTIRPYGRQEFDVDLVAFVPTLLPSTPPAVYKKMIGERLKAHGVYDRLLREMQRCWRLEYANEFHLDITPAIPNPNCSNGGELVPDKALKSWKPTNPRRYKDAFLTRSKLIPRMRLEKRYLEDRARAENVEPYPSPVAFKGVLRRVVQILKRHRDIYFHSEGRDLSLAPISVIVTTLAAWSCEYCVTHNVYDGELDLLCDIIRHMTDFIETSQVAGKIAWFIWNETTDGENFAEKWNIHPVRAEAFYSWHRQVLSDMEGLATIQGLDAVTKSMERAFGETPARKALATLTKGVAAARESKSLFVAPAIGLTTVPAAAATAVRPNTFFGR